MISFGWDINAATTLNLNFGTDFGNKSFHLSGNTIAYRHHNLNKTRRISCRNKIARRCHTHRLLNLSIWEQYYKMMGVIKTGTTWDFRIQTGYLWLNRAPKNSSTTFVVLLYVPTMLYGHECWTLQKQREKSQSSINENVMMDMRSHKKRKNTKWLHESD